MKKDITNKDDIILLVNAFYEKVKVDPYIGYIFTDVVKVNWEKHLPRMYDFWENTLFFTGSYQGNPMESHKQLARMIPLKAEHFSHWVVLFNATVDEMFEGPIALLAKQRALSIATIMRIKILQENPITTKKDAQNNDQDHEQ